jgi:hypothetical protein
MRGALRVHTARAEVIRSSPKRSLCGRRAIETEPFMPKAIVAKTPSERTIQARNHSCHGLTNKPTMPVEPLVCGDGEPNLAMTSSRVSPGGNSLGSRSVAVRMNV